MKNQDIGSMFQVAGCRLQVKPLTFRVPCFTSYFFILTVILLSSCGKGPGIGGTSTIKGKVYVYNYNSSGQLVGQYYAQAEHVYIIYGDDSYFGNDIKTNYDGTYEFDYLQNGSYTIFAYSKCDTCAAGQEPVMLAANISKNHSTVVLPDLVIKH